MAIAERSARREPALGEDMMRVVGVGASAGGLEAIRSLLANVDKLGGAKDAAWVVVVHLDPTHESTLADQLQGATAMPVVQVTRPMQLSAGTVHVIAPGHGLALERDRLRVVPLPERSIRAPIDRFFESLAMEKGVQAAAVILSGLGSDGTGGALNVARAGGLVLVQAPDDARFDGMPRSVIASGSARCEGSVPELAEALARWSKGENPCPEGGPVGALESKLETQEDASQELLERVFEVMRRETSHDFSGYRTSSLVRRIHHRMAALAVDGLDTYVGRLEGDPAEAHRLLADLLVSVTRFFRDPESFAALSSSVLPGLVAGREPGETLRVWVPGCATGEEVYSLAILFSERLLAMENPPELQVFGSDLDRAALEVARRGVYPAQIAQDVASERLKRFFVEVDGGFQVVSSIRSKCVFSEHDIVRDPPFSRIDLISCRNLLIYLDSAAKDRVLDILHYGLVPNGFLFLGPAESVPRGLQLFLTVDAKHRIFRKRASNRGRASVYGLTGPPSDHFGTRFSPRPRTPDRPWIRQVERILLEELAPASVVIDERHRVLYFVGRTSSYLGPPAGTAPTDQLLELTAKPLRHALREALREVAEVKSESRRLTRAGDDSRSAVEIVVQPLGRPESGEPLLLVTFRDVPLAAEQPPVPVDDVSAMLETELRETRTHLEATVGELEGTNDELKDANDELLSMNEELQSANEELQTSKEELQAMNEELRTLNQELAHNVEALDRASADMRNLFASTDVATLFLDRSLAINRFTPRATRLFRFVETDRGRPITDIATRFERADLAEAAKGVLASLEPRELQIVSDEGHSYVARLHPYRTLDNVVDGVVVTFIDVTDLKREIAEREGVEQELALQRDRLHAALEGSVVAEREFRAVFEAEAAGNAEVELPGGHVVRHNACFATLAGRGSEPLVGVALAALVAPEDRAALETLLAGLAARHLVQPTIEVRFLRADGRTVWAQLAGGHIDDDGSGAGRGVLVAIDVTERHDLEDKLVHARKVEAIGRLAGGIAHDFNNLITVASGHLELMQLVHPEQHELDVHFEGISAALVRATELTQQLLTFARRQMLVPRAILPGELVHKTERMLRRVIGTDIELVVVVEGEIGPIRADPAQIEQMLLNLVINARDAMPGGGRIEIVAANEMLDEGRLAGIPDVSPGPYVRLSVIDTGTGMDADTLAQCLDPFFTTKPVRKGTGLGLSSVYGSARQSGGFLEIESHLGRGTSAHVYLPRTTEPPATPEVALVEPPPSARLIGGSETILLVEDEPALLELNRDALSRCGYRVLTADNGAAALEIARDHVGPIHLVVSDVLMPVVGGLELARRLPSVRPGLPVLFVSGYTDSALPEGAAFLSKPFLTSELARRVREELDRSA